MTCKENMVSTTSNDLDTALDAALAMTFPASDPVALFIAVAEPLLIAESIQLGPKAPHGFSTANTACNEGFDT